MNVIVVDFGFGGLNIAANLYNKVKTCNAVGRINIIFYKLCYEQFENKSLGEIKKFYKTLSDKYDLDILVIACHSLGVRCIGLDNISNKTIIFNIAEHTRDLILEKHYYKNFPLIIFGSDATCRSQFYTSLYWEYGIVAVPCIGLAQCIENGLKNRTEELIYKYVRAAIDEVRNADNILVLLACTHYAFAERSFIESFASEGKENVILFEPCFSVVEKVVDLINLVSSGNTEVQFIFENKEVMDNQGCRVVYDLIEGISYEVASEIEYQNNKKLQIN